MDEYEAFALLGIVKLEARVGPASVHQLGNLEFVVILKARQFHLWSIQDYRTYLAAREAKQQARREERAKELVAR